MQCKNCKEDNHYAEANLPNGEYICYNCRTSSNITVQNNNNVETEKDQHTIFFINPVINAVEKIKLPILDNAGNKYTTENVTGIISAHITRFMLGRYLLQDPFYYQGSKKVHVLEYSTILDGNIPGTYNQGPPFRVFLSYKSFNHKCARALCEKDFRLRTELSDREWGELPYKYIEGTDTQLNYDKYP